MVTVNDVTQMMFRWAPPELAMDWDKVGLLVGRGDREVHRVLVALDVSPDVAAEAAETGADLIVSHHPVMNIRWHAQQMQTLREDTRLGGLLTELVKRDISAMCMHTNLDAAEGGVNDCLACTLGLQRRHHDHRSWRARAFRAPRLLQERLREQRRKES